METRTELNLLDYWAVLKKYGSLVLSIAICTFIIVAIHTFTLRNQYQARTTFYYPLGDKSSSVSSLAQSVVGKEGTGLVSALLASGGGELQNYTKGILSSRRVAEILVSNLGLRQRLHFKSDSQPVQFVQQASQVSLSNEGIIQVAVTTSDRKLSADIANGYVDAFREYTLTSLISVSKKHRLDVEQRMAQLKVKLDAAEKDMAEFQLKHKTHDFTEEEKQFSLALANLRIEQLGNEVALKSAVQSYQNIRQLSAAQLQAVSKDPLVSPALTDPIYDGLRQKLSEVYVQYAQAKLTETDANPELRSLKHQLNNIEGNLRNQIRHQLTAQQSGVTDEFLSIETKIGQIRARRSAIQSAIGSMEKKFQSYPGTGIDYLRRARRLKILETLYTYLSSEYEKAKMEEARESPDFQVLDTAIPPEMKIGPNRLLNLFMGLVLGMFLGVAAAFFVESTRPRIATPAMPGDGHVNEPELELVGKP